MRGCAKDCTRSFYHLQTCNLKPENLPTTNNHQPSTINHQPSTPRGTMNFYTKLARAVEKNESLLCVGLDPVAEQLQTRYRTGEEQLVADLLRWNLAVIAETHQLVCAYKPNIAFYEALGEAGMGLLRDTLAAIPNEIPVILDAKRGDIGSTAAAYAKACFEVLDVDAVTLSPYLGRDSVDPFAAYRGKGLFVLCHTSNPSAGEFQSLQVGQNEPLYIQVARAATGWSEDVGLVVGATYPGALRSVREVAPQAWFLVPGIGAQGGDVEAVVEAGLRDDDAGLIINAARGVTLAADHREAACDLRSAINQARDRGR
jgi:uridine monophosphate synthetase